MDIPQDKPKREKPKASTESHGKAEGEAWRERREAKILRQVNLSQK